MEHKFIKPTNTITIVGEMITDLGLKGNDLLIYAIISGFSQDGVSSFIGSISYFQEFTSLSRQGVINILKSLIERGLITKEQNVVNGTIINSYRVVKKIDYLSKNLTTCQENRLPLEKREGNEEKESNKERVDYQESKDLKEVKENKLKFIKEKEEKGDNPINTPNIPLPPNVPQTPLPQREQKFIDKCHQIGDGKYGSQMIMDFIDYWTEPNKSVTKMKFELQQTFEIGRRMATWAKRNFNGNCTIVAPKQTDNRPRWMKLGYPSEEAFNNRYK